MTSTHRRARLAVTLVTATAATLTAVVLSPAAGAAPAPGRAPGDPDLGPNVVVLDPTMSNDAIEARVNAIADAKVDDEMGTSRFAVLFKPGRYGSAADPLALRFGYGTEVAGLGLSPRDVTVTGRIDVYNRCFPQGDPTATNCFALNNFWRSISNLTISVAGGEGCRAGANFLAVSQAAPMRRLNVVGGNLTLMDYCSAPAFASGGFMADSHADFVISGSQQQWYTRDSSVGGWSNGVWNQVFSGVEGAPAECFPATPTCGPYTTLATTPVSREKPYLYVDAAGRWQVRVPATRYESSGTTWEDGLTPGTSVPLSRFYVTRPGDSPKTLDRALARGKHLLVTPGTYQVDRTVRVRRPGTVVLGLGLPALSAQKGATVLDVADVDGVTLAGLMVDAGPVNSEVLIRVGREHRGRDRSDDRRGRPSTGTPTALQDVFVRIGGPQVGKADVSLEVNSDRVLLDNLWLWRADHGNAGTVGWDVNTGDTGLVVTGDDVTATGLFVEHYQKTEVVWSGERGRVVFFQNELPYDPPSEEAWSRAPGVVGYPAFLVTDDVEQFRGEGWGSYSFFNQGVDIVAENAFQVPTTLAPGSLRNLLTVFLDPENGSGGIEHVVNDVGGSSTIANPSTAVTVTSYP